MPTVYIGDRQTDRQIPTDRKSDVQTDRDKWT